MSSCSFLLPLLQGEDCDPRAFTALCEQNALIICRDDVVFHVNCGDEVCNPERAACGVCGDGVFNADSDKECDDGNNNEEDACLSSCLLSTCGDGFQRKDIIDPSALGFEACDDGNEIEGDGCDSNCTLSACANEVVAEGEICFAEAAILDVGSALESAALGDLDRDQQLDLITTRSIQGASGEVRIFRHSNGAFGLSDTIPLIQQPSEIGIGDFDQQRGPDIAVALRGSSEIEIFFNNGFGQSVTSQTIVGVGEGVSSLFVDDLDSDFVPDLLSARSNCDNSLNCKLLILSRLNGGAGPVFTEAQLGFRGSQSDAKSANLDNNFLPDIVAALDDTKKVAILLSSGQSLGQLRFAPPSFLSFNEAPLELVFGDFDGDQDQDLVVRFATSVQIFFNDSTAGFTLAQTISSPSIAGIGKLDFDGDEDLDLAFTTQNPAAIHLLQNTSGSFEEVESLGASGSPSTLLVGDINRDNREDLLALDFVSSRVIIFLSRP